MSLLELGGILSVVWMSLLKLTCVVLILGMALPVCVRMIGIIAGVMHAPEPPVAEPGIAASVGKPPVTEAGAAAVEATESSAMEAAEAAAVEAAEAAEAT